MYNDLRRDKPSRELWGDEIQMKPPEVEYDMVMDEEDDHGIALLTDMIGSTPFILPIFLVKI